MWKYNSGLEESFTVAVWEQRGAGKSYYPFGATEQLCIDRFVQDTLTLAELLLKRFHQPTLFLAGHSWGSVLGVLFCKQYPHLVRAYIGCGQVVSMRKSLAIAYDYAVQHSTGKTAARLAQIDCAYTSQHWLQDLLFVTKQVVKCKGSLYGATNYNRFVRDFLFSKEYTWRRDIEHFSCFFACKMLSCNPIIFFNIISRNKSALGSRVKNPHSCRCCNNAQKTCKTPLGNREGAGRSV